MLAATNRLANLWKSVQSVAKNNTPANPPLRENPRNPWLKTRMLPSGSSVKT